MPSVTKIVLGLALGFAIGFVCRWCVIPSPAPGALPGAMLVLAMTLGYVVVDRWIARRPAAHRDLCGGPSGQ